MCTGYLTYTEQRTHGANLGGKLGGVYRPDPELDVAERLMLVEGLLMLHDQYTLDQHYAVRERLSVLCLLALFNAVLLSLLVIF